MCKIVIYGPSALAFSEMRGVHEATIDNTPYYFTGLSFRNLIQVGGKERGGGGKHVSGGTKMCTKQDSVLAESYFQFQTSPGEGWGGVGWGVGRMYTGRGKYCPADSSIFLDLDVCFYSTNTLDGRLPIHLGMPRREKTIIRNRKYSVSLVPGGL